MAKRVETSCHIMIMKYNEDEIEKMIESFVPMCIKCNYNLTIIPFSSQVCPNCRYSIVDSAVQQLDLHFKDIDMPPELMSMLKSGIRQLKLK